MKICSLLSAAALLTGLTLTATPAEDMLATAEKTEKGLVTMAEKGKHSVNSKGKKILDPVAYEAILLACQDLQPSQDNYEVFGYPQKALRILSKTYLLPSTDSFLERLMMHPSPNVRAVALGYITSLFGVNETNIKRTAPMLTAEKEPVVIAALIRSLANQGDRNTAIGEFLVRCLDHSDPIIRKLTAIHSCSSWNAKNQALADKLATLIVNEKDATTRKYICSYAGKLNKDVITDAYSKVIFTEQDPNIVNAALTGLISSWWSFPLFNTNNQKAYELTLKFFREYKPTAKIPNNSVLSPLAQKTTNAKTFNEWQQKASWYKAEDVVSVFTPYATDAAYPAFLRSYAIKILAVHGYNKAQLTELVTKLTADKLLREAEAKQLNKFINDLK